MSLVPAVINKIVGEIKSFTMDFGPFLGNTETISSAAVLIEDNTISASGITHTNTEVSFFILGGIDCERTLLTTTILTSLGQTLIDNRQLRITEQ